MKWYFDTTFPQIASMRTLLPKSHSHMQIYDVEWTFDSRHRLTPTRVSCYLCFHQLEPSFHPFVRGDPRPVVILTYQRCGSSFFGQLFNTNPDVFYMYEPLDSLYSSIYGTAEVWNALSDITNLPDGTERSDIHFSSS